MNGFPPSDSKSLPSLATDSYPLVPPPGHVNAPSYPNTSHANLLQSVDTSTSLSAPDSDLTQPITPITPTIPQPPRSPAADGKPKKVNPLTDLVDTEKFYVDILTGIIRKVAAAWSRSNLPPPELDAMFRSIEGVYRANRTLLAKLKEIGSNPSSPKALGDLLMRWIDDLEAPYTTYSTKYCVGFDEWEPVKSNPRLPTTLAMFSSSNPPPLPPSSPHPAAPPLWTLDDLFLLPKDRLKYYKKLYSRLLKSTTPGRSDHRLLTGALDKLDRLLATLEERARSRVTSLVQPLASQTEVVVDEVVVDMRPRDSSGSAQKINLAPHSILHRESDSMGGTGSSSSGGRAHQDTAPTSEERGLISRGITIAQLEGRLSTERTLDLFTMQPKQVRLQLAPPTLTYTRELRISADVVISLTPRVTGVEVVQECGHVFILTDLLLICERMTKEEASRFGSSGPDMWLLYPPLAGKHLRIATVEGSSTTLAVTILKKETLLLRTQSPHLRDRLLKGFTDCIETGAATIPVAKNGPPPPPVPALPPLDGVPSGPPPNTFSPAIPHVSSRSGSMSPPGARGLSLNGGPLPPSLDGRVFSPPPTGPPSNFPPRLSSAAPGTFGNPGLSPGQLPPSYGVGQLAPGQPPPIVGPPRGTSYRAVTPGDPRGPGIMIPSGLPSRPGPASAPGTPLGTVAPPFPGPQGQPPFFGGPPGPSRLSSDGTHGGSIRVSPSSRSLTSQYEQMSLGPNSQPPMPSFPDGLPPPRLPFARSESSSSLNSLYAPKPLLPSAQASLRSVSTVGSFVEPSPPTSPVEEIPQHTGPITSTVAAQMKCKVFLKQQHAQWKNLGAAKLVLYRQSPTNAKQLVVEADSSKKTMLISTIVLPDGVERVGKTGVAIELSDNGQRTGVVYMIQLRNETSAAGLFDTLLAGSDRSAVANGKP